MTTLATMRTRIASEFVNESITSAQIDAAIQSAIKHYQRERWYFTESRTETFNTVASQEFYGTADNANIPNLSLIDQLTITINSTRDQLTERSWEWIDNVSTTTTSISAPTDYCYYAQQIRLYPIPDAVYPIRISGLIRLAALSADSDSNAWMIDGEEMIRGRAKWDLAVNVFYGSEQADAALALEQRAYSVLRRDTDRRSSTKIKPWGM